MAKKKKKEKPKKRITKTKQAVSQSEKWPKKPLVFFIAGGVLVLIGAYFLYQGELPTSQGEHPTPRASEISILKTSSTNLRENRPTLSPQRFSGTFRMAYEVAREIPEVLDELYCYCRCQENFGHKNLLSCFVDTHAST